MSGYLGVWDYSRCGDGKTFVLKGIYIRNNDTQFDSGFIRDFEASFF